MIAAAGPALRAGRAAASVYLPRVAPRSIRRTVRQPVFYGWVIVAVTAVVVLATAGVRAAPGALLVPMVAEGGGAATGWSTSGLSLAAAIGLLVFGLSGPLSGRLMARYGIRAVTLASLVLTTGSLAASALATELWQIALFFGLLSGLGTGLVASVLGPTIANRWFLERPRSRHRPVRGEHVRWPVAVLPAACRSRGRGRLAALGRA